MDRVTRFDNEADSERVLVLASIMARVKKGEIERDVLIESVVDHTLMESGLVRSVLDWLISGDVILNDAGLLSLPPIIRSAWRRGKKFDG